MTADALRSEPAITGAENQLELPFAYPYPPFCRATGMLISKGGWVKMLEVKIAVGNPDPGKLRQILRATGIAVRKCDWRGTILECVRYEEGRRIVAAIEAERRCRSP